MTTSESAASDAARPRWSCFEEFAAEEARTGRLAAVAYQVLEDWDESEAAREQVLNEMRERWKRIDYPFAYARKSAVREAVRRRGQRRKRDKALRFFTRDATLHGEAADHALIQRDSVHTALKQLSQREAEVILMLANGWDMASIGRELGLSDSTVKKYRDRAQDKLRRLLSSQDQLTITEPYGEPA